MNVPKYFMFALFQNKSKIVQLKYSKMNNGTLFLCLVSKNKLKLSGKLLVDPKILEN